MRSLKRVRKIAVESGAIWALSVVFMGLLTFASVAFADDQSTMSVGTAIYGTQQDKSLLGNSGTFLHFQSESRSKTIRPTFTAQAEYSSGLFNLSTPYKLYSGQVSGGFELFLFKTNYVKPFVSAHATGGWASLSMNDTNSLGLVFGGMIRGGAEIRMKNKPDARALRITTGYRYLRGSLSGMSGFQLDGLSFSLGLAF